MEGKVSLGGGKPFPPSLPDSETYTVEFEDKDDPLNPQNWTRPKKYTLKFFRDAWLILNRLFTSILACSGTFIVSLNSAIFAPGVSGASNAFGVISEVGSLGTTLFVLGFASGPMIWAPTSELKGRKWPLTLAILLGGIFTIGGAVAKDIQTLVITRFFAGVCGASQLSVVPGALADVYNNMSRGIAVCVYALTVFGGPLLAPLIGGFIASSHLGWRWTLYLPAILSLVNGSISLLFLQETYAPCILTTKAITLRKRTKNWGIHAKHEEIEVDIRALVQKYFTHPLKLLFTEPILLAVSLYMSFIYGLVYALLVAYPVVFQNLHGMSSGVVGLMFIAPLVGVFLALGFILSQQVSYRKKLIANNNVPIPEWRLRPTFLGGPVFTISLFWFGWTGFTPEIHWAAPASAGFLLGFGVLCIFLPCFNYLVDAYLPIAASAVAANIILRSSVAAGFPLFTRQMFTGMGVQWACTLLGCLAAAMMPMPFIFRAYGPWLRGKSQACR